MEQISRQHIAKYSGINWKDILFYCFGDFGNCLIFATANVLLNKYYTNCLMFNPVYIIVIFAICRIWDAINDPIMGRLADKFKPNRFGKFKRWFLFLTIPYAIATVLMFAQHGVEAGVSGYCENPGIYVMAGITYMLFGMCMTAIQIPYGSLASVVTVDTKERAKLSIARGIAGNLGGLPVLAVKALAFKTEEGKSVVSWEPLIIGVTLLAVFAIISMLLCYKGSKERWIPEPKEVEKGAFKKALGRIVHNRAMLSICVISILVAGGGMFKNVITPFVSSDFFGYDGPMTILPDLADILGIAVTMFMVPIVSKKIGKKESSALGLYFATAINVAIMFLFFMLKFNEKGVATNPTVPYMLYVSGNFLSGLGTGFFSCLTWGMVADAIDDIHIKTHIREDGTSYSMLMFGRKVGQTVAFCGGQGILVGIGYTATKSLSMNQKIGLWFIAMLTVIICYGVGALLFTFWYPINRNRLEQIQDEKEKLLAEEDERKASKASKAKAAA